MKLLPWCILAGLMGAAACAGTERKDAEFASGYDAQEEEMATAQGEQAAASDEQAAAPDEQAAAPPTQPPKAKARDAAVPQPAVEPLSWVTDEALARQRAQAEGKGLIIDFRADWCGPCLDLENKTFGDPRVIGEVSAAFIPLKIDMTRDTERTAALAAKYGVEGLPAIVMLSPDGVELARVRKFIPAPEMLAKLRAARAKLAGSEVEVGK